MGVHMYDLLSDGRLVFVGANPAADRLLGVDNSQFVGKTIEEAFPPLRDTEVPERYRRAAANGEPWVTQQVDYRDGRIAGAYEVYAFQTKPESMAAFFLDITPEAEGRAGEAGSGGAAAPAAEAGVHRHAGRGRGPRDQQPDERHPELRPADPEQEAAGRLDRALRRQHRPGERARVGDREEPAGLLAPGPADALARAHARHRRGDAQPGARSASAATRSTIEADIPADLPTVKCRSQQIQQVLMNLLTNARDATNERYPESDPEKRVRIETRLWSGTDGAGSGRRSRIPAAGSPPSCASGSSTPSSRPSRGSWERGWASPSPTGSSGPTTGS